MTDPEGSGLPDDVDRGVKKTLLAIVVGWLVPGVGHVVLGRARRGLFFGLLLWASFGFGMAHEARLSLRDDKQPLLTGLQVVANLGMGPVDPIARKFVYGEVRYSMRGGDNAAERVETFRQRERSPLSIYGTAYVWTAGLMNLLLIFDLWDIGRGKVGMRSHLFHMLLYAGLLSAFFSVLLRRDRQERVRFALMMWGGLVGGALILAFVMAP